MQAITIKQPWAYAICFLGKNVENRTWRISTPTRLLIHAGSGWDRSARLGVERTDTTVIGPAGLHLPTQPFGALVAETTITRIDRCDGECSPWAIRGSYHWHLDNVSLLDTPIIHRGFPGLWDAPTHLVSRL